jgi:RIO-like serine/threonine protein kinase
MTGPTVRAEAPVVTEDGPVRALTEAQRRERSIIKAMSDTDADYAYLAFDQISRRTGIERRQVRLDVRRMARKGLAVFASGLSNDDGEFRGAGYALTPAGRKALSESRTGGGL